ncbi:hypothetical protein OSTOST_17289 [Ostertagia ostertagi]
MASSTSRTDKDGKLKTLRHQLRSTREELQSVKKELKKLKKSLPTLPAPETLYDKIVLFTRDVIFCTHILDDLQKEASSVSSSLDSPMVREKTAQILEAKVENCEMQLLLLRRTLRFLYAIPPLLVATNKISEEAWTAMLTQPQSCHRDGNEYLLPMEPDVVDNIIDDHLKVIRDLLTSLRTLRSNIFAEERTEEKNFNEMVLRTLQSIQGRVEQIQNAVRELSLQNQLRFRGQDDALRHQERELIDANAEYMEEVEVGEGESVEELREMREQIEIAIFNLENRIHLKEREKPCEPRSFQGLIFRHEEKKMRCAFCEARGEHYSDSCPAVRDGESRRAAANRSNRCYLCLDWWCARGVLCSKYGNRCFHCGKSDHHSALCCAPDLAREMEIEIDGLKEELLEMQRQRNELQIKIDQLIQGH